MDIIKETSNSSIIVEDFSLSTSLEIETPDKILPISLSLRSPNIKKQSTEKKDEKDRTNILDGLDSDINDCEPLYYAILEWLLQKNPMSLDEVIILDDTDRIGSANAIYIMMKFYRSARETTRHKMISDIYMLIKWNSTNCAALLIVPDFHTFLLEVLYEYQLIYFDEELKEYSLTVNEIIPFNYYSLDLGND